MTTSHADKLKPLVWLIEDRPEQVRLLTDLLQKQGYRVTHFWSNSAAVEQIAKAHKPFAILVDYDTGSRLNGAEFIQHLKQGSWSDVPAVGISSVDTLNRTMISAGAAFAIEKAHFGLAPILDLITDNSSRRISGLEELRDCLQKLKEFAARSQQRA